METKTKFRSLGRAVMAGSAALALAAGTAGAQTGASFTTTGYFDGPLGSSLCTPTSAPGATTAVCSSSGFTLTFTGASANNFLGNVSLGTFVLDGSGLGGTVPPNDVMFHLMISQTQPDIGTGTFSGDISGHIETSPPGDVNQSTLVFVPDQHSITIGSATYTLSHDSYSIPFNTSATNNTINADVTTTPEPSSMALLGTGLVGLVPMIRRRRK